MMQRVKDMRAVIESTLKPLVDGDYKLRNVPFGAAVQPPATVVGPPIINWTAYDDEPTDADFAVYVVVAFDERTVDNLIDYAEPVVAALETIPGVAVTSVAPTTYAPADLPCYMITLNASLS